SIRKALSDLKSVFNWSVEQGILESSPCDGVTKLPRVTKAGLSDRDRTTAHSWRHSVQDALRHAGVADDVRRQLLGHAGVGLAAGYGYGHNLRTLLDAVNKITYQGIVLPS